MWLGGSPFTTPLSQPLHFSIVWTFPMCFFKIYAVWNFLSQMLQLDSFFVVFFVVIVETKSTAEFFSTSSTLILNVHGSKSRSQLKSSTIFKTVSTFDCVKSVKGMTKYDLDKESDVALVLLHIWVANHMGYSRRVGRGKTEFYLTRPLTAGAVE